MVTKNLLVRGGADFSSLTKSLKKVNKDLDGFKATATKAMTAIGAAIATIGLGTIVKDAVKTAIGFEASMMQIQRTMGETGAAFQSWIDQTSASMGMGRAEATKFASVYSNLLSSFMSDTNEIATQTQALLKASAVVASATGRSMEDTMDRIRSGLLGNTESVEDLGINVNIAMIESTDAFKKFAGSRSWQQLDFQTQSQIRLFAILEQATKKYGDEIADNTASRQSQFVAQLKNIQLSLGQAFLPIYNAILPALTRMAQAFANVMSAIAAFSQALFGVPKETKKGVDNTEKSVAGLGDAYEEAGKKAKGSVAGFDEINSLAQPSAGAGAGAGASAAPEMATGGIFAGLGDKTAEVSQKMQEMADKVKGSFKSMTDFITQNKDIILAALAGLAAGIATFLIMSNWALIVATLVKGLAAIRTAILTVVASLALLNLPFALIAAAVAAAVAAFVYFYTTNETFRGVVDGILRAIADAAVFLWKQVLVPLGKFLWEVLKVAWEGIVTVATFLWQNVLVPLGKFLGVLWKEIFVPLGKSLMEMLKPTIEALSAVFMFLWKNALVPLGKFVFDVFINYWKGLFSILTLLFNNVIKPLAKYVYETLAPSFKSAFEIIKDVLSGLKTAYIGLMNFITGVFTQDWEKAWNGVKDIFGGVFQSLFALVKSPLNSIIDLVNKLIEGLNKIKIDVPSWVPGLGGKSMGINIPKIPPLAEGGIVGANSPMLAMVGDNRTQKEAIAPVDDLMTMISSAVLAAMNTQGNRTGDIVLNIDGVSFARVTNPYQAKEATRIGANMITVS